METIQFSTNGDFQLARERFESAKIDYRTDFDSLTIYFWESDELAWELLGGLTYFSA